MNTTYLIKHQEGKIFHFRVTVEDNGCSIVEGQFYKWISKSFKGIGVAVDNVTETDNKAVQTEAEKLLQEKLDEGYSITKFIETKENNYDIYDKAKYHFGGNFPSELDDFQGYVHTGMFVTWLIDNNLLDNDFFEECQDAINEVRQRKLTGAQFYESQMDGVLAIDELSELGNRFALDYFDFETGQFVYDYEKTLANSLSTMYYVEDSWDNYAEIKKVIDKRFEDWKIKNDKNKKPWWKIW